MAPSRPFAARGLRSRRKRARSRFLIRSIGTDHHRVAHAGQTDWAQGVTPIPAAALTVPDAEQVERILARGKPVTVQLTLTPRFVGPQALGQCRRRGAGPRSLVADHRHRRPSRQLGSRHRRDRRRRRRGDHHRRGEAGDGGGPAAADDSPRLVRLRGARRPRRRGLSAARTQRSSRRSRPKRTSARDRVWRFQASTAPPAKPVIDRIAAALQPLDIDWGGETATPGATSSRWSRWALPASRSARTARAISTSITPPTTRSTRSTARNCVRRSAAWTVVLAIAADSPAPIRPGHTIDVSSSLIGTKAKATELSATP